MSINTKEWEEMKKSIEELHLAFSNMLIKQDSNIINKFKELIENGIIPKIKIRTIIMANTAEFEGGFLMFKTFIICDRCGYMANGFPVDFYEITPKEELYVVSCPRCFKRFYFRKIKQ